MIQRRGNVSGVTAALACVVVVSVGCTMCPDPFDYSGPVPNGSPPQNDFRARSGGILPLGAAPRPWPTVVDSDGKAAPETEGGTRSILVADRRAGGEPAVDPQTDVVADPGLPEDTQDGTVAEPAQDIPEPEAGEVVGAEIAPAPEDLGGFPDSEAALVIPVPNAEAPAAAGGLFQARETPGWRPRR